MGYYFGTIPTNKVDIMSNSLGYVFDEARPSERYEEVFNMPMMYEFVFSAPHGTTTGFRRTKGKIEPILDDDDETYVDIVKELQEAALGVIKEYLKYADYLKEITVEDSISNYDLYDSQVVDLSEVKKICLDIDSIISDLQIKTTLKDMIANIIFSDMPFAKKRIALRKLKRNGLESKFIKMFLKLIEYAEEV